MPSSPLFSSVRFRAWNGSPEAFLMRAAEARLSLTSLSALPGGVRGVCPARQYRALCRLARRCRMSVRLERRQGAFFALRPLLRRTGLWAGLALGVPLLLWAQGFVWVIRCPGLTPGQTARVCALLRESCALRPGQRAAEPLFADGETALVTSGEFAWASLNFSRGRLTVEASPARPVPDIAAGSPQGLTARADGVVLRVNLTGGTALVSPGDTVAAGQLLISTERLDRSGAPLREPAAGQVFARVTFTAEAAQPLHTEGQTLAAPRTAARRLFFAGRYFDLPTLQKTAAPPAETFLRHWQPTLLGLPLPLEWEETLTLPAQPAALEYTAAQAADLVRLRCRQSLAAAWPDAECIARAETVTEEDGVVVCRAVYTLAADIVRPPEG